jgi:bifunctional non-homologous end joining protein LigD
MHRRRDSDAACTGVGGRDWARAVRLAVIDNTADSMSDSLDRYREMRDFTRTPEPAGARPEPGGGDRFVIQQHDATALHWDLRLERDGVLASWALPRGVPWTPDENHLAVHTEDHPLEYLDFHGEIPEGSYGAGSMFVWDQGTFDVEKWEDRKVIVVLHGERVSGRYVLFETRGRDWIIHRMDPPADPKRRPVPDDFRPMQAVAASTPPRGDDWAFEIRWRGIRVLARASGGAVDLAGADGTPIGNRFPEVRRMGRQLGMREVVLDGVLVGGSDGRDPDALPRRLSVASESAIRRLARDRPTALMAFDLLWLDGYPLIDRTWNERRERLEAIGLAGPAWTMPGVHRGDGLPMLEAAAAQGLWGLVGKHTASPYQPGNVSDAWVEIAAPVTD